MIYISEFSFPSADDEWGFFMQKSTSCYTNYYPFQLLPERNIDHIDFMPVTILHGGNGSGKTTILNIIAEYLIKESEKHLRKKRSCGNFGRSAPFNKSCFFRDYLEYCDATIENRIENDSQIITSDDVFDYILNIRDKNEGIDRRRDDTIEEYNEYRHRRYKFDSLDDYEDLKKMNDAKSKSTSQYVKSRTTIHNIREHSNGESALNYFIERLTDNGLYILDEPENSLSPENQIKLAEYINDSARFFGCQFIISTHSPFMLSIPHSRIYDLDDGQFRVRKWTELNNVRQYYNFFRQHKDEFER